MKVEFIHSLYDLYHNYVLAVEIYTGVNYWIE